MTSRPTMKDLHFTDEFSRREDWDHPAYESPDAVKGIRRYWGKFPGVVVNPIDPEMRCRLLVNVPDVTGPNVTSWALPCLPYAGPCSACTSCLWSAPMSGWNSCMADYPIWTGFWYGSLANTPKTTALTTPGTPRLTVESLAQHAFVISDTPVLPYLPKGGVLIKSGAGSYVAVDATGVRVFGASVQVNGMPDGVNPLTAALAIT